MIHPSAIVSSNAQIADDVVIGAFSIVSEDVVIGSGCVIEAHVSICQGSRIGKNNHFHSFCSVGESAQHLLRPSGEDCLLIVGDNNTFREYCTLNKGLLSTDKTTRIGSHNYVMSNSHFGHDSVVGDHNVIGNGTQCAGHIIIGDHVYLECGTMIHQYCRIGNHALLGAASVVIHDVPSFTFVSGESAKARSINLIGMRRKGFDQKQIANVRRAFRVYYTQDRLPEDAVKEIRLQCTPGTEIDVFVDSLKLSERGNIQYRSSYN